MSKYYGNYSQYLGAQRCCDIRVQGPQGPQGPAGPASIGPVGNTGPAGISYTGPTGRGCKGATGEAGSFPTPTSSSGEYGVVSYSSGSYYYDSTKTFVIEHPNNVDKFLVHGCLEGPEAGVYYRGKDKIVNLCNRAEEAVLLYSNNLLYHPAPQILLLQCLYQHIVGLGLWYLEG